MRLARFSVKNFRSIRDSGDIRVESLQAFVGENNSGKSNCLRAIQCFLASGAGGMGWNDFSDPSAPCVIECEFTALTRAEQRRLRAYLLGDRIILRKELSVHTDETTGKKTVKAEFHGYQAEPRDSFLSMRKIEEEHGTRPRWREIAERSGILEYVIADGSVTKASYKAGIERYLREHDVQYDEPELGATHALGIPQNLLSALPEFYLLPAITDYSDEIDKRSSSTVFRRLMADLSERIMTTDPRRNELEDALNKVKAFLNRVGDDCAPERLSALSEVETSLLQNMKQLMPTIASVCLKVEVESTKEIFARGVCIQIDDGVVTEVIDKGNGMQRSVVFALLKMLIESGRREDGDGEFRSIILAIEEPELYIHPHNQRLIFRVLREFAGLRGDGLPTGNDQVIYTTHAPAFVEVWNYDRIALVRKPSLEVGTIVSQADKGVLGDPEERKTFKLLTCFGLRHNELFFSREILLVEGPEDEVAIVATARKMGRISELPDEIGLSIVVTDGKGDLPKFQKVLNAFGLSYGVLLELDGKPDDHRDNAAILNELDGNRVARIPEKLETLLGINAHFADQRHAKGFFDDPANISEELEKIVSTLLPPGT